MFFFPYGIYFFNWDFYNGCFQKGTVIPKGKDNFFEQMA